MRTRKILFILCFCIAFMSMASVSADDLDDVAIGLSDDVISDGLDDVVIQTSNNNRASKANISSSLLSSENDNFRDVSFSVLQRIIDDSPEGSEINLTNNYSLASGGSTIQMSKSLTINGNGHALNGNLQSRIMNIDKQYKSIIFKNLTFTMGYVIDRGAAILNIYSSNSLEFYDCVFEYNTIGHGYDIDYTRAGGAAVYSEGSLKFTNTNFYDNEADSGRGGAVFCLGNLFLNNTDFSDNEIQLGAEGGGKGSGLGGAVYCEKDCTVYNSVFHSNHAGFDYSEIGTYGGGIYCCGNVFVYNSSFNQNQAYVESGGAIYAKGNLYGDSLNFYYNIAYTGCGVFCEGETHINNSQFRENLHIENTTRNDRDWLDPYHVDPLIQVKPSSGGGIYSVGKCYIDSCIFEDNFVCELGAAIYAESDLKITGKNSFTHNCVFRSYYFDWSSLGWRGADKDGGAIYAEGNLVVDNAVFSSNTASVDGGAIYGEKKVTVSNSKFEGNNATGISTRNPTGGAIQSNGLLTVNNCEFYNNMAEVDAGAIYAKAESVISNSVFKNNFAEAGLAGVSDMGGAIRSKGTIKVDNCSFNANHVAQYGGAIYADNGINVNHSSFSDNKAGSIDGGAIYSKGDVTIDNSNFTSNKAEIDGGAVFSGGKTTIYNSKFNKNKANGEYYEKSYGGAVRSKGTVKVYNSIFDGNHANRHGGAIYGYDDVTITGSTFCDNSADVDGGAIYTEKGAKIYDSSFSDNEVTGKTIEKSYGGAIRTNEFITVKNSSFEDNSAPNLGGAIYCDGDTEISDSSFSSNTVDVDGGAVYSEGKTTISGSTFENNKATGNKDPRSFGGAVRSNGETTVMNSIFNNNFAYNNGGAIYADRQITIKSSSFKGNEANDDGGAVYSEGDATISNSKFIKNKVLGNTVRRSFGGGVCSYGKATLDGCSFENNYADNRGGGIFAIKEIVIRNSNFTGNTAKKYGGAVYTRTINHEITHSAFINNKVNEEDGGAIYINNSCSPTFTSCRFQDNSANEEGGAIFLDSQNAELTLRYCTFVDNKAGKSGQSVFDCGYYSTVTMCWFGKNYVTFEDELKIWHKAKANEDYHPPNHLYIDIALNDTELYVGNTYKLTGYLYLPSLSHPHYISEDLLHSSAKLSGDAIFSNAKVDLNNITADILFTEEYPTIYLTLDHQTVSLKLNVTFRHPSKVNILSCDDVEYPNAFKANYEILNMTDGANYEITDGKGDIVRTGNITNPKSTLSIDGLDLGDYSLWIFNPGNFSTASSLDHTYFKVIGTVHTNVTADNVTYGNPTTFTLRADHDGEYDLTIINYTYDKNLTIKMNVVDGVSLKQLNLSSGNYQTFTSGGDYRTLISSEASFRVDKVINHIAVEVEDVIYGEESIIKVTADVDRSYTVKINGHFYYVIVNNGFGSTSLRFDAGSYYANVSTPYMDKNYFDICKNTTFQVHKANITLSVVIRDQYYPRDVEGIVYASVDGEYNLRFGNENGYSQTTVIVKDNVGHFNLGTLNSGKYEANLSFPGNTNYNPNWNLTGFEIFRPSTSFEIQIVPSTVTYGDTGTVMPIVSTGATGTVKYYLHNGTLLGELDIGKNFILPVLDVGSYMILANYSGDVNFNPARDSKLYAVNPALNKVNVSVDNVTYGNDTLIRISADVDGSYRLDVNGTEYNITVENGVGSISLSLDAGVYYANVAFDSINYNTSVRNAIFEVYKADVDLILEVSNITYPQEFKGIVRSNLDGVYNFTVDNYFTTLLVKDGLSEFNLGLLDVGSYRVTASYSGDRNFNPALDTVSVTVNPGLNNVIVSVDNVSYGETTEIELTADADGKYIVHVLGIPYEVTVTNGIGKKSLVLDAGQYSANVTFDNKNYNTIAHNTSFEVYKANIDLVVVVFDEVYGDEIECLVYASRDGDYSLTIAGYTSTITVKDSFAYYEHTTLDAGRYEATVFFRGDKNYNPAFNNTTFTVYPVGTSFELEISSDEIVYGETATVTHTLSEGATGTIKYYLNDGTFLGELDVGDNLTLPVLDAGNYMIIGNYSGDHNFIGAIDSTFLTVKQAPNNVAVTVSNVTYGNDTLISVCGDVDGIYQVDINGTIYNVTVENGVGEKSIRLDAGIYYANVTFDNKNYNTSSQNAKFEVFKADINLTIEISNLTYPQEFKGVIHSNLDGKYNFTVDDFSTTILVIDGVGNFNLGLLDAGTYRVSANCSGNRNYNPANYTVWVTVNPALNNAIVTVDNVTYGNDTLIVVTADADGNYQVDINGTVYNVAVREGVGEKTIRLDSGSYYANVSFKNINYNTSSVNATFSVYKGDIDLIVFAFDVFYPENLQAIVYASVDGEYNLTFNKNSTFITVKDNYVFLDYGTLDVGTYDASISFAGNDNYNPAFNKTSITVYPSAPLFKIEANPAEVSYADTATVTHILSDGATGTIRYYLHDGTFLGELDVGDNITLPVLDAGNYVIIANYSGNGNFISAMDTLPFAVKPALNNVVVGVDNVTYGNDTVIVVTADVDGRYQLDVNSTIYNITVENGLGNKTLKLDAGIYYANLTFDNKNYNTSSQNATFEVYKADVILTIEVSDLSYPQEFKGIIHSNLDGEYNFTVDGNTTIIMVENGIAQFNLGILDVGSYPIAVDYSGERNYNPASDAKSVTVKPGANNVAVAVDNVTYGNDTTIVVTTDADGAYQLDVNGTIYNITVEDGTGNISVKLNAGVYYANVTFENKNYNTMIQNAIFEVYKAPTDIFVVAYDTVYPQEIEGIIYSDVDGEYNLSVGDYSTVITVIDGRAYYNAGSFDAGNYTVLVSYSGDLNHYSNSSSRNVTVDKYVPDLVFSVDDIDYGDFALISITCDVPGSVNVTVNGITETLELNGQTKKRLFASILSVSKSGNTATLRLYNLDSGSYPVTVTYNGDKNIESLSVNGEFKVNALNVTMDIDVHDISVGEDETIIVKLSDNVTGNLTITVDGKNYSAPLKDGKATVNIIGLSAGNKTVMVQYSGNRNYNSARGNASFAVNKLKPNMTALSDDPIDEGQTLHIVVNLPKDATGTVTLTIDGKKYSADVKNGKASFDISGLAHGRYDVTIDYSGDDKYEAAHDVLVVTVNEKSHGGGNDTDDNHSDVSPRDIVNVKAGNPIIALLLAMMTVCLTTVRRFKK